MAKVEDAPSVTEAERRSPPRRPAAARPPAMRGAPYLTLGLFLLTVALVRQFGNFGLGDADLVNTWLFYTVLVVGFYFVFGVSGQFAFSQAAFAAVGGYTSAWATREEVFGTDTFWVGLVVGDRRDVRDRVRVRVPHASRLGVLPRDRDAGLEGDRPRSPPAVDQFTGSAGDTTAGIRPITIFGFEIAAQSGYRDLLGVVRRGRVGDAARDLRGARAGAARGHRRDATRTSSPRPSACPRCGSASRCSCSVR